MAAVLYALLVIGLGLLTGLALTALAVGAGITAIAESGASE